MDDLRSIARGEVMARRYRKVSEDCDARALLERDRGARERAAREAMEARRAEARSRIETYLPEGRDSERFLAILDSWLTRHADNDALDDLNAMLDPRSF